MGAVSYWLSRPLTLTLTEDQLHAHVHWPERTWSLDLRSVELSNSGTGRLPSVVVHDFAQQDSISISTWAPRLIELRVTVGGQLLRLGRHPDETWGSRSSWRALGVHRRTPRSGPAQPNNPR